MLLAGRGKKQPSAHAVSEAEIQPTSPQAAPPPPPAAPGFQAGSLEPSHCSAHSAGLGPHRRSLSTVTERWRSESDLWPFVSKAMLSHTSQVEGWRSPQRLVSLALPVPGLRALGE